MRPSSRPEEKPMPQNTVKSTLAILTLLLSACTPRSTEPVAVAAPRPPCTPDACPEHPLYGFWGLNGYITADGLADLKQRLGLTVFHTATIDPAYAIAHILPLARDAGLRVTLRLTGDHPRYTTTPEGDFDLAAWKAMLAPWAGSGVQPFIDDGTLFGHMLLDDIYNFEGRDPTAAELEEMARYSKALLPGLMTFVRERATVMPEPASGRYEQVDAAVNQYKSSLGDVEDYANEEASRSAELGLGIINGLNIANGGDGSSGQPGWGEGRWAMSGEEIARYGAVLAAVPDCGMFLTWEYDGEERWAGGHVGSTYFDKAPQQQALYNLGAQVSARPPARLMRP
jgi:hypothetical protein